MKRIIVLFISVIFIFSFSQKKATTPYVFPKLNFFPKMPISTSNFVTNEGVELGKYLFYDKILSKDTSVSCASCHNQEKAFSDSPNIFSKGISGKQLNRNTLPLFNLAWYSSFFWDGRASTIEEQVLHPINDKNEMNLSLADAVKRLKKNKLYKKMFYNAFGNSEIDSLKLANSLAQFLRTLVSYQSKYDRVLNGKDYFTKDEYDGFVLVNDMTKGDCLHCHTSDADALGTTGGFSNNGLDSIFDKNNFKDKGLGGFTKRDADLGKFKIPSLRNLLFTAPYMHDGRFTTLEQVLDFYSEGVNNNVTIDSKMGMAHNKGVRLTKQEKTKIIAFLKTMSDSVFIKKEEFANPFRIIK